MSENKPEAIDALNLRLDRSYFVLGEEEFKRFVAILENPPSSNPRLERLLKRKPPWER